MSFKDYVKRFFSPVDFSEKQTDVFVNIKGATLRDKLNVAPAAFEPLKIYCRCSIDYFLLAFKYS